MRPRFQKPDKFIKNFSDIRQRNVQIHLQQHSFPVQILDFIKNITNFVKSPIERFDKFCI